MKKRILSLLLVMTLVFACAVPVWADTTPVSTDVQIQAAFEKYAELEEALAVNEYGPMKDAYNALLEMTGEFTDEQSDEFTAVIEDTVGTMTYLGTMFDAAYTIDAIDKKEAYQADANAATAYAFVQAYDACVERELNLDALYPGVTAVYDMAKSVDMPSENVLKVYEAYTAVQDTVGYYDESFLEAVAGFEAVLDIYNELTDEEFDDLAALLGVADAEEAYSKVLNDWIFANVEKTLGEVYYAYIENPTKDTASAFVEYYDSLFVEDGLFTEEELDAMANAVAFSMDNLKYDYDNAKTLMTEDDMNGAATDTDTTGEEDAEKAPETGDNSMLMVPFAAMLAAGAAAVALRRKSMVE